MTWNFGDILDTLPTVLPPEAPALIHWDRAITWEETSRRSNDLARAILARGAKAEHTVALYLVPLRSWNGDAANKAVADFARCALGLA